jgi:DNA-binding NtrC family response regulator
VTGARRILVVDDESGIRRAMERYLGSAGYVVDVAETCEAACALARTTPPDVALLDFKLPDGTGLELLRRLAEICPGVPTIFLTAHGSIDLAVDAVKAGAEQFLTKPVDLPALLVLIERLLENQRARRFTLAGGARLRPARLDPFLGEGESTKSLAAECRAILDSDSTALILGETGTGKGVLARWLHENGPRAKEAFVDLNCASLSRDLLESELFGFEAGAFTGAARSKPGLLEVAHKGTVFLDEIGDVDLQIQPKLLKVLDERRIRRLGEVRDRHIDIRLITATHQDLDRLVREGKFRQDLYFRINAFPITVPPLRSRRDQIPLLARHFVGELAAEMGRGPVTLSPEAARALVAYHWPGNVRELRNVIERALLLTTGTTLDVGVLRFAVSPAPVDDSASLEHVERQAIEKVLREERWRVPEAARKLRISKTTLYEKIRRYGLKPPQD